MDEADISSNEVKPLNPFEKSNVTRKHIKMVKANQMHIISGANKFLSEMWHKITYEIKKPFLEKGIFQKPVNLQLLPVTQDRQQICYVFVVRDSRKELTKIQDKKHLIYFSQILNPS